MAENALTKEELLEKFRSIAYSNSKELEKMGKKDLKELWESVNKATNVLDAAVPVDSGQMPLAETASENPVEEVVPSFTDEGWTDYVLKQFAASELEDGNPKVDGLRRVAERLLGPFNIIPKVVQSPSLENGATVTVMLEFLNDGRMVGGSADVSERNTQREYAVHSVATAETRAEGRALRKALRLTKVLAAEELHNADADEPTGTDTRVPTNMIQSLNMMCQKVKLDLNGLVKHELGVDNLDDLTIAQARKIATFVHEYRTGAKEYPDEIKTL